MKLLGYIILACVLLSLVQAALSALLIIGLILLVVGLFIQPAETFGFLAFGLIAHLFQTHPIAAMWLISLMVFAAVVLPKGAPGAAAPTSTRVTESIP